MLKGPNPSRSLLHIKRAIIGHFEPAIFAEFSTLVSAVAGFYFGAKTATAPQTSVKAPAPEISDISPDTGKIGTVVAISNLSGSGFQAGAADCLVLGTAKKDGPGYCKYF